MSFESTIQIKVDDIVGAAQQFREVMGERKVVRLIPDRKPSDLRSFYDSLVEAIGNPVAIAEDYATGGAPTGDRWSEIGFREDVPDDVAFRHSRNAQPLHTDESYVSEMAGVMFFYCASAASSGGETVFVDGPALVDHLRETQPALLEQLLTNDITYSKADDAKTRPIIAIGDDGNPTFNFNYFCADPEQSEEALQLNKEFHEFLENDLPDELQHPVGLNPGESVAWKDSLVLHGRNAFQAEKTGDRLIWKAGIEIDSMV